MKYIKNTLHISSILIMTSLVACSLQSNPINTGALTNIAGVSYKTETQSGVTSVSGEFNYKDNETITFSLGDLVLGETVTAKEDMTVFDLVPNATLYTTTSQVSNMLKSKVTSSEYIAFVKFSNILWLLQSIDDDSNQYNGINIPPGVVNLLTETKINLGEYGLSDKLKLVTNKAANLGLLNSGAIKPFGSALDEFYKTQNIKHRFMVPATIIEDSDANGEPNLIQSYTYDINGNKLTTHIDRNGDGTLNYMTTNTYDANGNILTTHIDDNADGILDNIKTYTYDVNGNQLTTHSDDNADGKVDSIGYYTYDTAGNSLTYSYDQDVNGKIDRIYTYTYDDNGNQLTDSTDKGADGKTEYSNIYTYDDNGNLLTKSSYRYDETTPRSTNTYTYNADGNLLTHTSESIFSTPSISTYTYDSNGKPNKTYTYTSGIGQLTFPNDRYYKAPKTYTYDNDGNMLTVSEDTNENGTPNNILTYTYDVNGNNLTTSYDRNADGKANYITSYVNISATWVALLKYKLK